MEGVLGTVEDQRRVEKGLLEAYEANLSPHELRAGTDALLAVVLGFVGREGVIGRFEPL